jgi:hypothetical protein
MVTQTTDPFINPDLLTQVLDTLEGTDLGRQILFQSLLPGNASPTQTPQFQNLFHPVFTQFLGELGSRVRSGGEPNLTFDQFLAENFDPQRALLRLPEARTGALGGPAVFNFG